MGFTEILTIIFIVLKVLNVITWSWWVVFLPEIIAVALYLIVLVCTLVSVGKANRAMEDRWNNF